MIKQEKQPFNLLRRCKGSVKYGVELGDKIKLAYERGDSIRKITRDMGCSRRYVQFLLFPDRLEHAKALYKARRKDGRYYRKEKHRVAIAATRKKKREIQL